MLARGRAAGAHHQRGAGGRPVRGAGPPAAGRDRAKPLVELGRRKRQPVSGPESVLAGVRSQSARAAATSPIDQLELRISQLSLDGRINQAVPADAGNTWSRSRRGAPSRQCAWRAPGGVLLGGVRHPRVPADVLGRPRDPGRRSSEVGERSGAAAGRRGALLSRGLHAAVSQSRRLAAGNPASRTTSTTRR